MSDVHVDPTFPVVERASCPQCGAPADLMADVIRLSADRARLEQENAWVRASEQLLGESLSRTKQALDAALADRNSWRTRADEAAATLRAYRMGKPDEKHAAAMRMAMGITMGTGSPLDIFHAIKDLCEAASIPMPRIPLTRAQAVALSQKHADRAAQGLCENWGDAAIDAIIEASK